MSISDKTKKSLEKIGLTSYEIRAYTILLKIGESNASEISQNSGVPYSKQSNITQEAASGINDRSTLEGSLNGSRLPWQFRLNAKVNKEFKIKW